MGLVKGLAGFSGEYKSSVRFSRVPDLEPDNLVRDDEELLDVRR